MIKPLGFIDTSHFTAWFLLKFKDRMQGGILPLRTEDGDLEILKEWKSGRALMTRLRTFAAPHMGGQTAILGRVWLETVEGQSGTPWIMEEDDYAQAHIRARVCLTPAPGAYSFCGAERLILSTGIVNVIEHRALCSEINLSEHPRTHLIVDFARPEDAGE